MADTALGAQPFTLLPGVSSTGALVDTGRAAPAKGGYERPGRIAPPGPMLEPVAYGFRRTTWPVPGGVGPLPGNTP
jgi:hypothetical protein